MGYEAYEIQRLHELELEILDVVHQVCLRNGLKYSLAYGSLLGEEYTSESFTGDGVNIFRVLVCNAPLVLSFLYRKQMFENTTREENLIVNLTMLNGAIMFVGLFGTANYFGRLANYFLIFQSLSLPWMLKRIGGREGRMWTMLVVLGYVGYFYYANIINQPFDQDFARLTVSEYLTQLEGGAR